MKFKRTLRLQSFLILHLFFYFRFFLTVNLENDPYIIKTPIKSSDFLFWNEKILESDFWRTIMGNMQTKFHILKSRMCEQPH